MDAPPKTVRRAKKLRREMTLPEVLLWRVLGHDKFVGWKFRRQHPKGRYVLDFYCDALKLAVEVDGHFHHVEGRPERDARRDAWLERCGIQTLRIPAREVLANMEGVYLLLTDRVGRRFRELTDRQLRRSLPGG